MTMEERLENAPSLAKRSDQSIAKKRAGPSQIYLIHQWLSLQNRPITAPEIAKALDINPNSVRGRLSELVKRGEIRREYFGAYSITPIHGAGLINRLPRVQNLVVSARGVEVGEHFRDVFEAGDIRIYLEGGSKRGILSYRVGASFGLGIAGLRIVHAWMVRECERRGFMGLDWEAVNFEFLTDHGGLKLEGVQIATWEGLAGYLEKFYNRPGVRREARGSGRRGVGMAELEALLDGSLQRFELVGEMRALREAVNSLETAQKWVNRKIQTFIDARAIIKSRESGN